MSPSLKTRLFLVLWVVLCSDLAHARDDNTLSNKQNVLTNEYGRTADKAYDDGRFEEAILNYKYAYRNSRQPIMIYNIAQAYRKSSLLISDINEKRRRLHFAIDSYEAFLRDTEQSSPDVDSALNEKLATTRQKALKYYEDCRRELAELQSPLGRTEHTAKPVYKRWWFWTAIGGAAIIGAVAVGLGVGLRPHSTQIPDGVPVYEITF